MTAIDTALATAVKALKAGGASRASRSTENTPNVFRHSLLREVGYAMLTETDRVAGHKLAGEWLEQAGERDALTMADHFEKGGEPGRAVPWLLRATDAALSGSNVEATLVLGNRAISCGAEGVERGRVRQAQAMVLLMRGDLRASADMSREAVGVLPVGSPSWFASAGGALYAGFFLGDPIVMTPPLQAILDLPLQSEASAAHGVTLIFTCVALALGGQFELAASSLRRAEALGGGAAPGRAFMACLRAARAFLCVCTGELGAALAYSSESRSNTFGAAFSSLINVMALAQTGSLDRTETALHQARSFSEVRDIQGYIGFATEHASYVKVLANRATEAVELLSSLRDLPENPFLETFARAVMARALAQTGDFDAAEREATLVLSHGSAFPTEQARALVALSLVARGRGRAPDALAFAERGLDIELRAPWHSNGSMLRLVRAEALHALGRTDEAQAAVREARDRILHTASTLDNDPELRESYLNIIHTHARTLELAREWLGDEVAIT